MLQKGTGMKKIELALILLATAVNAFALDAGLRDKVEDLIRSDKYEEAYSILDKAELSEKTKADYGSESDVQNYYAIHRELLKLHRLVSESKSANMLKVQKEWERAKE